MDAHVAAGSKKCETEYTVDETAIVPYEAPLSQEFNLEKELEGLLITHCRRMRTMLLMPSLTMQTALRILLLGQTNPLPTMSMWRTWARIRD